MNSMAASTMSSNLSPARGCAVILCPRSDCDCIFSDNELLDLHVTRIHKCDVPKEPMDEALTKSLKSIREQKQTYFKLCPPRLRVEENIILHCLEPTCDRIFDAEELRDFHYYRMHHARAPSILSQLTGTVAQRLYGYECLKADCDSRFLSEELRDFHTARVHPKVWQKICEIRDAKIDTTEPEESNAQARGEKEVAEEPTRKPRETTSLPQSKESIFSQESGYSTDATSASIMSGAEEDCAEKLKTLALDEDKEGKQEKTDLARAEPVRANSDPTANQIVEKELARISRPPLAARPRSIFMMNRNALANPGASMWRPQE